ncbi:MAG: putative ABC transporter permease [Clostridiales bacterium]|nr:putative ABC transporter permease [Clostridiales bacterium]
MKISKSYLSHKTLASSNIKSAQDILSLFLFFFFTGSVFGFLWEVLIFLVKEGTFRNRGFLYGPWLPIYGIGAALFYLLLHERTKKQLPSTFLLSSLIGGGLELLVGWQLNRIWGLRYWDYTGYFLHYHGYICFFSVVGFGLLGCLWLCFLSRRLRQFWFSLPKKHRYAANTILGLLFLLDCTAALILPNVGSGITFP